MYIPDELNRGARRAQDHPPLGVDVFAHRPWPRVLLYGFPYTPRFPDRFSGPDSPGAHGSVLVSMPTAYAVRQTVGNSVARGLSLPDGGSDQQPPSRFMRGVWRLRPVSRALAPQWDLALVLRALSKALFEPLDQVPLNCYQPK